MTPSAFQELHDGCRRRVLSGIRGYVRNVDEAEDVTAAAFATAYQKRKSFRRESSFFTWVYRIAINEIHAGSRRKRTVSLDALEGFEPGTLVEPDLLDRVLEKDACCRRIRLALKRLPANYRGALVDHFVRGFSVKQIAKLRRVPLGTVLKSPLLWEKASARAWEALNMEGVLT